MQIKTQSQNPKEIPGRGGEDNFLMCPPHLISWWSLWAST